MPTDSDEAWPVFPNAAKAVLRWTRPDGQRRVYLVRLQDSTFTWGWQTKETHWFSKAWGSTMIAGGSYYDSLTTARAEMPFCLPQDSQWIKQVEPQTKAQAIATADSESGWQYWGEAQMLSCPFCGGQMERARLQMFLGGGGDVMSTLMAMATDTSGGGKHIRQECKNCEKTFESRLAPDREVLKQGTQFHQWRPCIDETEE